MNPNGFPIFPNVSPDTGQFVSWSGFALASTEPGSGELPQHEAPAFISEERTTTPTTPTATARPTMYEFNFFMFQFNRILLLIIHRTMVLPRQNGNHSIFRPLWVGAFFAYTNRQNVRTSKLEGGPNPQDYRARLRIAHGMI